ncbi:MAG: hypothetical protein DMG05_23865 [Acidobacteria bacterium]|nr:MAG: hypothetical protein DMG05_23865 [Acidobacteriota bacterium]
MNGGEAPAKTSPHPATATAVASVTLSQKERDWTLDIWGARILECAGLTALSACGFDAGWDYRREEKLPASVSGALRR